MSRELQSGICDDDPNYPATTNDQAEGLAFCGDGVVVLANNDSLGAFGDSASACAEFHAQATTPNDGNSFPDHGVGTLRKSGTLPNTGYVISDWKDVLRLLYTGCKNTDGSCANTVDRIARCSSPERQELIANWANLFEGVACPQAAGCPAGLRHAYRRDDYSGTTGNFLSFIGVAQVYSYYQEARTSVVGGVPLKIQEPPQNHSFCDGGHAEGLLPTHLGPATAQFPDGEPLYTNADPIRTPCAPEDDLCGPDGKLAVVRAVRTEPYVPGNAYATHQCKRSFEYKQYINTALPVCPDRTKPSAGRCRFPFFEDGSFKTFNCLTSARQASPAAVAGTDGRVYNFVIHENDGTVIFEDGRTRRMPYVAQWRQNQARLDNSPLANGKAFTPSQLVCIESDATRTIGCLTANSRCTLGFAGREAAFNDTQPTVHLANEPVKLNGLTSSNANIAAEAYPLSRLLWLNASRGFENIMIDCKNRGGSKAYCEDQRRIAQEFFNVGQAGNLLTNICLDSGYIPLETAVCKGAQSRATCGAPTSQILSDCAIDPSDYDLLVNN